MMHPGDRLRAFASRVCDARALEHLIDPLVADLQHEYAEARRQGRTWQRRWIRAGSCIAFWKVLGLYAAARTAPVTREWLAADNRAIGRTLRGASSVGTLLTAVLILPPLLVVIRMIRTVNDRGMSIPLTASECGWVIVSLIPQALAIGIAIGVPVGILWGVAGRTLSSRSRRVVAALAIVSALATWFTQNSLIPAGNQAFREFVAYRVLARTSRPARGPNELSVSELSARIDALKRVGLAADARPLVRSLYMRLVVSVAPLVLGLFAIAVCSSVRTGWKSTLIGFAVTIAYISFYTVINPAAYWSATSRVQPFMLAFLPNALVASVAFLLFRRLPRSG